MSVCLSVCVGEEKFDSLTNFYCRNASCAIVVFDLCSAETFQNLPKWVNKVKNEAEQNCQIIIVGNKADAAEEGMRKVDGQNAQVRNYRYDHLCNKIVTLLLVTNNSKQDGTFIYS